MPTPIPSGEKTAFIAIVNAVDPQEALRLATVLVNYEDVPTAIGRQQDEYAANNQYLTECLNTLNQGALIAAGTIFNQTTSAPTTNPALWVNSQTTGGINITTTDPGFGILGNSNINKITLSASVILKNLYIGPGSTVDALDGSATGAITNTIYLPYLKSTPSALNIVRFGSTVGSVQVDKGSYYGGIESYDPNLPCALPVTGISATEVTQNGVLISWTPPGSGYIFITTFYRLTNSKPWILADEMAGEFVGNTGFIFRNLEADTYYDFQVSVMCNNGGINSQTITTQTTCCGGGDLTIYKQCGITVLIVATPDPSDVLYLCNGTPIPRQYPAGTTLTIPYLAGKNQLIPFIVDNANLNDVPFNPVLGEFNAAASTLTKFVIGNVVQMNFSLPA